MDDKKIDELLALNEILGRAVDEHMVGIGHLKDIAFSQDSVGAMNVLARAASSLVALNGVYAEILKHLETIENNQGE